jgi:hypothetical protein
MTDSARTTVFVNAAAVATCIGPVRQTDDADPAAVVRRGAVAVRDGVVAEVGDETDLLARYPDAERVDCGGGTLAPGFVDSHTHAVFGKWRTEDYRLRCQGVPYMESARRGGGMTAWVRLESRESENQPQPSIYRLHESWRKHSDLLLEERSINRCELRDVRDRVLGQPSHVARDENVPGSVRHAEIGRQHHTHRGADAAAVERIRLHNDHGPPKTRLGTSWLCKVCPPHLAPADKCSVGSVYHSPGGSERVCARRMNGSSSLDSVA